MSKHGRSWQTWKTAAGTVALDRRTGAWYLLAGRRIIDYGTRRTSRAWVEYLNLGRGLA